MRKPRELPQPLLCDRKEAAALLGVSVDTVRRLEREGRLRGRKLFNSPSACTFYLVTDLLALAGVEADATDQASGA